MGNKKFYETPVGFVRAELLTKLNANLWSYSVGSVEFRLGMMHLLKMHSGLSGTVSLVTSQLTDIAYFSGSATYTQESMGDYSKKKSENSSRLYDYLTPYIDKEERKKEAKESAESQALRREKLVKVMESNTSNGAFSSLNDILDTLKKLNETIGK